MYEFHADITGRCLLYNMHGRNTQHVLLRLVCGLSYSLHNLLCRLFVCIELIVCRCG